MKLFNCIVTGKDMFSDARKILGPEVDGPFGDPECHGVFYKFTTKMTTESGEVEVNTGANASAEEAAEDVDKAQAVQQLDILHAHKLVHDTQITSKKQCLSWLKSLLKHEKIKPKVDALSKEEKEGLMNGMKMIYEFLEEKDKCDVYYHEEGFGDGTRVFVVWNDDGVSANAYSIALFLEEEKCWW